MDNKCVKLWFNFRQVDDGELAGEDYDIHEVGKNGVAAIIDHMVVGGPFSILFNDGRSEKIFNPNRAFYQKN